MFKNIARGIIIFLLLVIVTFIWSGINRNDKTEPEPHYSPEIKLSSLSDELYDSLTLIDQRAAYKQKELNNQTFKLGFLPLFKKKTISSSTPLVLQIYYEDSDQLIEKVASMPLSFIGLTSKQLASVANEWEVKEYRPGKALILYRKISGLSPADKNVQHLGTKNGKVAIFYGESGDKYLKQLTDIKIANLPDNVKETLEKGIVVYSQEELLTILEGLVSIINQD